MNLGRSQNQRESFTLILNFGERKNNAVASVPKNAATGASAKASSEETNKNNFAKTPSMETHVHVGAPQGGAGQWLKIEFKEAADIQNIRILGENNAAYRYTVEARWQNWKQVVDQSNKDVKQITPHKVDAKGAKFFKITFHGSSTDVWGSLWNLRRIPASRPNCRAR